MRKWLRKNKWNLLSLFLGMTLAFSCAAFIYCGTFEELDNVLSDQLTRQFDRYSDNDVPIIMIAIDGKTTEQLGDFTGWSRQTSADLINRINSGKEKPIIIGMDIPFEEEKDIEGDTAFVEACESGNNVCLVVQTKMPDILAQDISKEPFVFPYEAVREVVLLGLSGNLPKLNGDAIREFIPVGQINDSYMDSFAVALYKAYQDHAGKEYNLAELTSTPIRFNYSRNINEYETYSAIDVLNGTVSSDVFANKIVIIGDYNAEQRYSVPDIRGGQMTDAGLQANILEALLSKKIVSKLPSSILAVIYGSLIFGCYTLVFLVRRRGIIPKSILVLAIHFQLAYFLRNKYYLPIIPFWIHAILAILLGLLIGYYREKENIIHLRKALETYVEADVADEIIHNVAYDIKLGGQKKDIAVLFVDIRGFTGLSEVLEPEEVVKILNKYFEMVSHAVINNGGNIDKFIGDAAMAIFNAPKELDHYVLRAIHASIDILEGLEPLKKYCLEEYNKEISFGIGIQCGPAIVGNIGCDCHMDYTAIGDTVNTASRLESKAKAGQILISKEVYDRVKNDIVAESIGKLALKGKSRELNTYQVLGILRKEVDLE